MPEVVAQTELPLAPSPAVAPKRFELPADDVVSTTDVNTEDAATPAKPEAKPEPELTPEQTAKRDERRAQNKLEKAYRKRAEAQARADFLEKQLVEERAKSVPKTPEGEPRLEQFDYDPEKYATAKAEYAKKQAEKEIQAKQQSESQRQYQERITADWEDKVARADEKYEDFSTVVGEIQPNTPFTAAIFEAENGEDVAYYLGKNPKEATRIAQLSPLSQVREIGRLQERLLSKPAEPKAPSRAPAPITPVSGAAAVVTDVPSEEDDMKTWIRKREKQLGRRR